MIVLRLRGGLGNQMFQFAAAKALAEHHRVELKLDLYYYSKHPYRKFELEKFKVPLQFASRKEVHQFTGSNPIVRYLNKRANYLNCQEVFTQPYYHFYPDFFSLPNSIYLNGYFQSEKYFAPVRDKLTQWYSPEAPLDEENLKIIQTMSSSQSVSIHVRRGDYTSKQYNSFFGGLDKSYYTTALQLIRNRVSKPSFYIFSDDIAWCKSNLMLSEPVTYVEHNKGEHSYKDLILMSRCRNNIIANSSFSWWGGWLNPNPAKIVVAPKQWFRTDYYDGKEPVYPERHYNTNDLIPDSWERI